MRISDWSSDVCSSDLADSLISEFHTVNGRLVYDGSGIYPDIPTDSERFSNVTYSIMNNLYHFDYATEFRNRHNRITPVGSFAVSDELYGDFVSWLDKQDFAYKLGRASCRERVCRYL